MRHKTNMHKRLKEHPTHQAYLCIRPYGCVTFTCLVCMCLSHQRSSPPCSCGPPPPLCFSKIPGEPWPPATASPSNTHFTLPIPHMNNTWSDSLCWVNESIASRASETLMASQHHPLARHQMSTVQSDELWVTILRPLLPCREGNHMWFSAARLIFKHMDCKAAALVQCGPAAVCPWACRWGYMLEHAYEGRFNWYFYACVNKHPAEYLIVVKVVRHCSYLS